MPDFMSDNLNDLNARLKGKTISMISLDDTGINNKLIFNFSDGQNLFIEYDWIYEYEISNSEEKKDI